MSEHPDELLREIADSADIEDRPRKKSPPPFTKLHRERIREGLLQYNQRKNILRKPLIERYKKK